MKYQTSNYLQFPLEAYKRCEELKNPNGALALYLALKKLEHQFCTDEKDYFYRSDEQLTEDAHMSLPTIKRQKKRAETSGIDNHRATPLYPGRWQKIGKTSYCVQNPVNL